MQAISVRGSAEQRLQAIGFSLYSVGAYVENERIER